MNFLKQILDQKKRELVLRKRSYPLEAMRRPSGLPLVDFASALSQPGLSVIAEIKRKSPSRGTICERVNVPEIASSYTRGGASALSVLTDERFFGGQPDDLVRAKEATPLPVLRKDFIIDAYQVHESKHMGADAVLLITAALTSSQLGAYLSLSRDLGLAALVEVHCERELGQAIDSGATIIGINNRDLTTGEVDLNVCLSLRKSIPSHCVAVAESGIRCRDHFALVAAEGFDAVLIGESLMEARDPARFLQELAGAAGECDNSRGAQSLSGGSL